MLAATARSWRRALWRRPEWWALAFSALAWGWLLASALGPADPHAHHQGGARGWAASWLHWEVMVAAMMIPFIAGSIRITAQKSLWPRRDRAMAGFLLGYLGLWGLAGLAVVVAVELAAVPAGWGAGAAFLLAAGWQLSRTKRRASRACRRTMPLAPRGWRADLDCVRYGWMVGRPCFVTCWALMLACALSGHNFVVMLVCTAILAADRLLRRPNQRLLGAAAAGAASVCFASALLVGS